jgi:hypothetical protein
MMLFQQQLYRVAEPAFSQFADIPSFIPQLAQNGTARFFTFSLNKEGATEKVLQFVLPLKSI